MQDIPKLLENYNKVEKEKKTALFCVSLCPVVLMNKIFLTFILNDCN